MNPISNRIVQDGQAIAAASVVLREHLQRQVNDLTAIGPRISAIVADGIRKAQGVATPGLIAPVTPIQRAIVINAERALPERFEPKSAPLPDDYTPNKIILISGVN